MNDWFIQSRTQQARCLCDNDNKFEFDTNDARTIFVQAEQIAN